MPHRVTRRLFLHGSAAILGAAGTALLVACGGAASVSTTASTGQASASAPVASTAAVTSSAAPSAATSLASSTSPASTAATTVASSASVSSAAVSSATLSSSTASSTASSALATSTAASSAAASAPATKGVTLTYLSPDDQGGDRHKLEGQLFAAFSKANPGISVELPSGAANWTEIEAKLKTGIAAGQPVNLFQNGWGSWSDVQTVLMELSTLFNQDKMDPKQIFALPAISTFTDNQGKIWAVPVVGISQDGLAYNKDMFDAAGLQPPPVDPTDQSWTMDKFLEYAQKLTKADQLQFGFGGSLAGFDTGGVTRGTYFDQGPWDDSTQKALLDQSGAVTGLQYFKDLRDKYHVQPNADQVKSMAPPKGQDLFASGKIGMQVVYGYVLKQTFNWGLAALPHSGSQNVSGRQYAQPLQGTRTPLSDQTWTLFRWVMSPQNAASFPLTAHYAVSPVNGASDLAQKTYKEQVGVDPQAFVLQSQHSHVSAWGMTKYAGWTAVNKWLLDNFPAFDQGKQTAADYAKAATAYIDANLLKG